MKKERPLSPMERVADLARRIVAVQRTEIDEAERKWKAGRKRHAKASARSRIRPAT